jgi:hypothetical protein
MRPTVHLGVKLSTYSTEAVGSRAAWSILGGTATEGSSSAAWHADGPVDRRRSGVGNGCQGLSATGLTQI